MRNFKIVAIITTVILILSLVPADCFAADGNTLQVDAKSAYLVETQTGDVIYAKNEDMRLPPASTTKMMTVMLAIEACERGDVSLDSVVTASENCNFDLSWDSSTVGIQPGEQLTLENLIICALVASANEACNIIAEFLSGSVSSFVALMNRRAQELGCFNTHFANTHGLPSDDHYSSAKDLYLIANQAMKYDKFAYYCNLVTYTIPATNMSDARELETTNELINPETKYYSKNAHAVGIKTGSTDAAGFCLISSAEYNDIKLISVVLGASATPIGDGAYNINSFAETSYMFRWVFSNYSWREILSSTELTAELPVTLGEGMDSVIVHPASSISDFLPNSLDLDTEFTKTVVLYNERDGTGELKAPIKTGQELGEISLNYNGEVYGPVKLVANTDVNLSKAEYMKARIKETLSKPWLKWTLAAIGLIVLLYLAFIIRYNILRARHKKKIQRRREAAGRNVNRDSNK